MTVKEKTPEEIHDEKYPEHVKLRAVADRSQTVGGFLDWLRTEKHLILADAHEHTDDCYTMGLDKAGIVRDYGSLMSAGERAAGRFSVPQCGMGSGQLWPATVTATELLAEFFEIDTRKIAAEKDAMLEEIREANRKREASGAK